MFVQVGLLEFMERLVAIIPQPRTHQVLYYGVFANNAKYRKEIQPKYRRVRATIVCAAIAASLLFSSIARKLLRDEAVLVSSNAQQTAHHQSNKVQMDLSNHSLVHLLLMRQSHLAS